MHAMTSWHSLPLLLALHALWPIHVGGQDEADAERRLFDHLRRFFDTRARPVIKANRPVAVNVSFVLKMIKHLAERNQTLITHMWIYEEWTDELMRWNPKRFANIETIALPPEEMWTPDIYVYNNADRGSRGYLTVPSSRLLVEYTGRVRWLLPVTTHSLCAVDVTYFPFDNQRCDVHFGSWLYDSGQLRLALAPPARVHTSGYVASNEFHLISASLGASEASGDAAAAAAAAGGGAGFAGGHRTFAGEHHTRLTLRLHIRRKPLYYLYTIIAPTIVLCILTVFSFALPCDSGAKVGIGLTVFLSLYLLQSSFAENVPEPKSVPLLGLFLMLVMTLIAASLLCATLVMNLKKKGDQRAPVSRPVPRPVLALFRRYLARLTFTTLLTERRVYGSCQPPPPLPSPPPARRAPGDTHARPASPSRPHNGTTTVRNLHPRRDSGSPAATTSASRPAGDSQERWRSTPARHSAGDSQERWRSRAIDQKFEWYFVAEVVDKLLCVVFILSILLLVVFSLFVIPYIHRDD